MECYNFPINPEESVAMEKRRVTLKDLAKECGVSVNTVSRALRDDPLISRQTRSLVQRVAGEMGYIKNSSARALSSGRSYTIAMIVNDIRNPHYGRTLSLVEEELRRAGYDMIIFCMEHDEELRRKKVSSAISHCVDGIIYFPFMSDHKLLLQMERNNIPYVLFERCIPDVQADSVRADDEMAGFKAGEHVLRLGHRKILYLNGLETDSTQVGRKNGFRKAVSMLGDESVQVREVDWNEFDKGIQEGRVNSIFLPVDYTAIVAFNDEMAYIAQVELEKMGLRIPQDISVLGFDHVHSFMFYAAPMTSIAPESGKMEKMAVRFLLNRIENPATEAQVSVLPVQLYDEGTTAPPPQ